MAAARLGRRAAIITGVGDDPFGRYVRKALRDLGVDDRFVVTNSEYATPVTFCEIFPPDDFPLYFYRKPTAPDLQVRPDDIDFDAVRGTRLMWLSVTGLSEEPSRASHFAVLEARARKPFTVLDLDYRPMFWADTSAAREQVQRALPNVTVAVGNREEAEVASGESDPERAADALLDAGVELAMVKQGPKGVLAKTRTERVESPPMTIRPMNGLGAGDSFGGSLCHGLLAGWPLEQVLRYANAAGAIVASRLECSTAMPTLEEIETLLAGGDPNERLADDLAVVTCEGGARSERCDHRHSSATGEFVASIADLNDVRVTDPGRIARLLETRQKAAPLEPGGKLMIIACDHPARGALGAGRNATAMASRTELLERLLTALARPGVDGLLATADIVEDMLLLGALAGKFVFGSMNRGGLQGSVFEMDDRNTGYDVQGVIESGLDGSKMLLRIDLADPATVATLESCGRAVTELNRAELIAMVEPFMSSQNADGRVVNDLSPDAVIKSMHIAQGLGATSAYTWLKLPVVDEMERVMDATTLPTLLLGGDPDDAQDETFAAWQAALTLPSVRGLVVGRTMLYPADDDVAAAVDTAVSLVR